MVPVRQILKARLFKARMVRNKSKIFNATVEVEMEVEGKGKGKGRGALQVDAILELMRGASYIVHWGKLHYTLVLATYVRQASAYNVACPYVQYQIGSMPQC